MILRVISSIMMDWPQILRGGHGQGARLRQMSKDTNVDLGLMLDLTTLLSTDVHSTMSWSESWMEYENRAYAHLKLPQQEDQDAVRKQYEARVKLIESFRRLPFWQTMRTPQGICEDTVTAVEYLLVTARRMSPLSQAFSCFSCDLKTKCNLWSQLKPNVAVQGHTWYRTQDPEDNERSDALKSKDEGGEGLSAEEMQNLRHEDCPWQDLSAENQEVMIAQFFDLMNEMFENEEVMQALDPGARKLLSGVKDAMASQEAFDQEAAAKANKVWDQKDGGTNAPDDNSPDEHGDFCGSPTGGGAGYGTNKTRRPSATITSTYMGTIEVLASRLTNIGHLFTLYVGRAADGVIDDEFGKPGQRRVHHRTEDPEMGHYRDSRDLGSIHTSAHAYDDTTFYANLASGHLPVSRHNEDYVKEELYVLLDSSGSMQNGVEHGDAWMCPHRGVAASAVASAICHRAQINGGRVFFRNFDTGVSELTLATRPLELEALRTKVVGFDFNGSGTNLDKALEKVAYDFTARNVNPKETEFLLISDLCTAITPTAKAALQKFKDQGVIFRVLYMEEGSTRNTVARYLGQEAHVFCQFNSATRVPDLLFQILKRVDPRKIQSLAKRT